MGITRLENLFRCRSLLDLPQTEHPSFHQMFQEEISVEQDILNATSNSQRPWATNTYALNYTPGLAAYTINVTNFGKPILVTKVINSPYVKRVNVPFDDVTQQHYGTVFNWNQGLYNVPWDIEDTPERMSFYRENVLNAQYRVTIEPQPQWSGIYEIMYIPGYIGDDDPLEASIQLPEHAELIRLRVAMGLLPYCKWSETATENTAKRMELAKIFEYKLNIKEPLFAKFITNITIPRQVFVEDWDSY